MMASILSNDPVNLPLSSPAAAPKKKNAVNFKKNIHIEIYMYAGWYWKRNPRLSSPAFAPPSPASAQKKTKKRCCQLKKKYT
jgi:hypothetical protein